MTSSEVLQLLSQYKLDNAKKYGINSIGIFGSYAVGNPTDASDIDIVVETQHPDLFALVHIKEELENIFRKRVDIVRNSQYMNPFLKKRIAQDARYV